MPCPWQTQAAGARQVRGFRAVTYELRRGCAAAYFPLVPVDDVAERSHTPSYKNVEVSISPSR